MRRRAAFSLAECVVAVAVVGVLLVAALTTTGASRTAQHRLARLRQGRLLAQALLSEVLDQAYAEDDGVFGPEPGEATGNRSRFDDVDDYAGWSESPPQARDGTVLDASGDWSRTVAVEYVQPQDLAQAVGTDLGVKRITVRVSTGGAAICTLVAVRTRGLDEIMQ